MCGSVCDGGGRVCGNAVFSTVFHRFPTWRHAHVGARHQPVQRLAHQSFVRLDAGAPHALVRRRLRILPASNIHRVASAARYMSALPSVHLALHLLMALRIPVRSRP